ncbi:hypothetical protein Cgig2_032054 [Carnegiea gigantea]|uniref:Mitochondrial Rho GTPase n=1 Tax=Carnegiea gigantea TaxID=171969 RepID=A0A9Q1K3Y5_9CARY|nr:hypothetical protein Cgig2_032054 [Carnegiea gigantea]
MAKESSPGNKNGIRIVIAGDRGTGKSSLIVTAVSETFPTNVPPVLPPSRFPDDMFADRVPITIVDTSSSLSVEQRSTVGEELKRADAAVLTYACDRPETLDRSTYWLPELRRLEVKAPVIVVGCKLDLRDEQQQVSLEQIPEVFYYAQKAVLHPTAPLFDQETQTLRPQCVKALKRMFFLCDHDKDGALSDAELNDFQVKCSNAPLQPSEIVGVKRVVQEKLPEGVNERGLTLRGFLFLHALFIEKGCLETTWTVLRKFGYNNDIRLDDDFLPPSFKRAPDQSVELANDAVGCLKRIFNMYDNDNDGAIRPADVEDLFSTASDWPFSDSYSGNTEERYAVNVVETSSGSQKFLVLREIPEDKVKKVLSEKESLAISDIAIFVYDSSDELAWRKTAELVVEVAGHGEDTGYEVPSLIVAAKDDLDPYPMAIHDSTRVSQDMGIEAPVPISAKLGDFNNIFKRIVGSAERPHLSIPETEADKVTKLLSDEGSLVTRDIAIFVYDRSQQICPRRGLWASECATSCVESRRIYNESSWKKIVELLMEVAGHWEYTGYEVPSVTIAAQDDLDPYLMAIHDSTRVLFILFDVLDT